jgi:hypothetical protein
VLPGMWGSPVSRGVGGFGVKVHGTSLITGMRRATKLRLCSPFNERLRPEKRGIPDKRVPSTGRATRAHRRGAGTLPSDSSPRPNPGNQDWFHGKAASAEWGGDLAEDKWHTALGLSGPYQSTNRGPEFEQVLDTKFGPAHHRPPKQGEHRWTSGPGWVGLG